MNHNWKDLDYWEARKLVAKIIPRITALKKDKSKVNAVREKGRKSGYHQYSVKEKDWIKQERLLSNDEINSFVEVSVRAAACPMPLNIDTYDSTVCVAKGEKITTIRGSIPIEDVIIGDFVLSYNEDLKILEYKPVLQTSMNGNKKIVEIETEIGFLKVTSDHRVYTQRGWVEAGKLLESDLIYTFTTN